MKFEHTHYNYDHITGKKLGVLETIVIETEADSLSEVVDSFERFLKAVGYSFSGKLEFLSEEELFGVNNND